MDDRYFVLGTAGHIDHGKTSLVKALTGVDCDRFAEEKERGITIDIGFARYTTPSGITFGIVDMPGHARFIRNMVAGAVGIDLVLLVVAADDGVMPQTIEHLHIARLLGVDTGVVALTKADLVDDEILELARADIAELVAPTFLAGCPIIPVSSVTGLGLGELTAALEVAAEQIQRRRLGDRFRMPVDRSFSIKGVGTVVTGTALAGKVKIDDELEIMPGMRRVRVRGIQVHNEAVREIGPGHRTAINLAGIDKDHIQRGDVLVAPDSITSTYMFDAEVETLPGSFSPLRPGSEVLLHVGTSETTAKVHPLDSERLPPDANGLVQLRLPEEMALAVGDRFIIRSSTAEYTIGGGRVLDAHPNKHKRRRTDAADRLTLLLDADLLTAAVHELAKSVHGLPRPAVARLLNVGDERLAQALSEGGADSSGIRQHREGTMEFLTVADNRSRITKAALKAIGAFHSANKLVKRGLGIRELSKLFSGDGVPAATIVECLEEAVAAGELEKVEETYALPGRELKFSERDRKATQLILSRMGASTMPVQPDELLAELRIEKQQLRGLVSSLVESGELVQAPGGVYFTTEAVAKARERLLAYYAGAAELTVGEFNKLVNTSRKYGIPLLQYFEQQKVVVRDGDVRRLAR